MYYFCFSKSNDDRQRKMQELKKDFELSDTRLVQLISGNRDQLSVTMEAFSKISAKINSKFSVFSLSFTVELFFMNTNIFPFYLIIHF